ncbi:CdaR family transcriptional regulator [uncultured Ruthenibacterium sp.]|uniref:CdaR family transcriptional regulator n=1 Tax=uncultured Ruthenibacterium sp. TaxID=1905347 RepID=UPI00349E9D3B
MHLDKVIAQKMVDRMMQNLGYNINMMDAHGVIIASGQPGRVGKVHMGARQVLDTRAAVTVFEPRNEEGHSSQPGINMPLYYQGEIVGVVGITGDPAQLGSIAPMIQLTAELLLEQESISNRRSMEKSAQSCAVSQLLTLKTQQDAEMVLQWARRAGYDLRRPRAVCLLKADEVGRLASDMRHAGILNDQDIVQELVDDTVVILKSVEDSLCWHEAIRMNFEPFVCEKNAVLAVGDRCCDFATLKYSYRQAQYLLQSHTQKGVFMLRDEMVAYLVHTCQARTLPESLEKECQILQGIPDMSQTVQALCECNMNLAQTAKQLFVHRNTVVFRLQKVRELLGLAPFEREADRIHFHVLAAVLKEQEQKGETS